MPTRHEHAISANDRFWKKARRTLGVVGITGANGFIGTAFATQLVKNDIECRLIGRHPCRDAALESVRSNADLLDSSEARKSLAEVDSVFHLAGPPSAPSAEYSHERIFAETSKMAQNVSDAVLRGRASKALAASSVLVYPPDARVPVCETARLDQDPADGKRGYALGKREMERVFQERAREHGFSLTLPRFANVYGPLDAGRKPFDVVSFLVAQAKGNEPLRVYGNGKQTRSFLFVDDCIVGMVTLALANTRGQPVNLAPPTDTSIGSLARKIKKTAQSASEIRFFPDQPAGPLRGKYDVSRAKKFGFSARVTLSEGLARTIGTGNRTSRET